MADQNWTPSLVEERLVEAADVLKRLPDETRQGYFSTWPAVLLEFSDLVGQEPPRMKRPWPSPAQSAGKWGCNARQRISTGSMVYAYWRGS